MNMIAITIPAMTTGTFTTLLLLLASFTLAALLVSLAQYATAQDNADALDAAELADLLSWADTRADHHAHTVDSHTAVDVRVAPPEARHTVWWDGWL